MINNTGIDDSSMEGFGEFLSMGLNASADIFSKLLNADVSIEPENIVYEKIAGLASFGGGQGIAVSLDIGGAIYGKAIAVIQSEYVTSVLNALMSDEEGAAASDEIDEMAIGTLKELIGQMSSAFADSASNFFGSNVSIVTMDVYRLSDDFDEIAEVFECANDKSVYSIVAKFDIGNQLSGRFNIELNKNTFDFTLNRLNMLPGTDAQSMYMNAVAGGMLGGNGNDYVRTGGPMGVMKNSINIQSAQFPTFNEPSIGGVSLLQGNMDLLMDVPLNVTIEIGKARKKMRDIMEFAQGTIIDLEKQAGAPVDIVVNGQLIARGDVVVIDDNFGVRITEIIGNNTLIPRE